MLISLLNIFFCFGVPEIIHSDQGTNFKSSIFQETCKFINIVKKRTCPYNPKFDGMVERLNRTIIDILSKTILKLTNWDELVPLIMIAYRSAIHSASKYTPNLLMFGRKIC